MLAPNTILQSRYRIIHQLGHGGMGAVYQAMDENLSCLVAVKETFAETDEHRRAFRREAELLANLNHPALPRVMDHFVQENGQFLVMQYIAGDDLAKLLEIRERPFPLDKVFSWADQLLDALEELHAHRPPIVHRDIKPSNLKLTPKGKILLLDFGLAKGAAGQMSTVDQDNSGQSLYAYTRHYAPLEQMRGAGTDPRSDLYSLAATVWSLLTAEIPPDALARVGDQAEGSPDPLRPAHEINAEVPPAVAAVLHQALVINRHQRPKSATEMRQLLREAMQQAQDEKERDRRQAEEATTRRHEEEEARRKREAEAEAAEAARRAEEERLRREREEEERRTAEAAAQLLAEEREAERQRAEAEKARQEEREQRRIAAERQRVQEEEEKRRQAEAAAEVFRQIEEEKQRAAATRRAEDEARRREEKEHRGADVPPVVSVPPTQSSQKSSTPSDSFAIKTLPTNKAAPLHKYSALLDADLVPAGADQGRRTMLVAIIAGVAILAVAALVWMRQTPDNKEQQVNQNATPTSNQSIDQSIDQSLERARERRQPPLGMVYVPGGEFTMGLNGRDGGDEYERPAHRVTVKPFFIDVYEVTNEDYEKFIKATDNLPPPTWRNKTYPAFRARYPVTGVTWDDARAYAAWAGKRLPTEEEWEFAARGTDGRRYPWGNGWQNGLANAEAAADAAETASQKAAETAFQKLERLRRSAIGPRKLTEVGAYKGVSPFGVYDMVGNAWEWTDSKMIPYPGGSLPIKVADDLKVIRGGSFASNQNQATTTYRRGWRMRAESDYRSTGFRCVKDIANSAK